MKWELRTLVVFAGVIMLIWVLPGLMWRFGVELRTRRIDSGTEDFEGVKRQVAEAALTRVELDTRESVSHMVDKRVERAWWSPAQTRRRREGMPFERSEALVRR